MFFLCTWIVPACSPEGLCQRRLSCPSIWRWALLFSIQYCGLIADVLQGLLCCHNSLLFFYTHRKSRLGCLWSWNSSTHAFVCCLPLCLQTEWVTEQLATVLTHYALTQAEEKLVPTSCVSFRQDLNILITFHCVPVNDIHYLKCMKYQKYRYFDLRIDFRGR